jgi:hypothetical protein
LFVGNITNIVSNTTCILVWSDLLSGPSEIAFIADAILSIFYSEARVNNKIESHYNLL